MKKITPCLWFDKEAKEAAELYTSVIGGSRIVSQTTLHNTPSGDVDMPAIELAGQPFILMSAGPLFKFTPAVSFLIACSAKAEVDQLWQKLGEGGRVLMELGDYPFSERYGWLNDKYGLSWQVMYTGGRETRQKIVPMLMFVGLVAGKAEEAINFYVSVFSARSSAKVGDIERYGSPPAGREELEKEGTVRHATFTLLGQEFSAIDSNLAHNFNFNEAISLMVPCEDQAEIDYYWEKLSAVPESEQCGWLKDKYGMSWQIVPAVMDEMMAKGTAEQIDRLTQAFLPMKKLDIAELKKAYEA